MGSNKKILFANTQKSTQNKVLHMDHFEKAKKYGFSLKVPGINISQPVNWDMLNEYDAILTCWGSPRFSGNLIGDNNKLKIIGHAAGSVAQIVDRTTYNKGIRVTTANPIMAESVAEWSLLATLLASRNFGAYSQWFGQSEVKWTQSENMQDIKNMTIGIWGFGDISKHLLSMLKPLRPGRILVCSKHSSKEKLAEYGVQKASLEDVLSNSDIIHTLTGVNQENFERIGSRELALIKNGATLINGGRARLFQEESLLRELQTARFNGIFDVFFEEPLPLESSWRKLKNVILTPHNAGYTGRERFIPFILDEFKRFFDGEKMLSEISYERFLTMTNEKLGVSV